MARLGKKTRLASLNVMTVATMVSWPIETLTGAAQSTYDFVVVDEAQDISISQLRYLAQFGKNEPGALFFAGDLGQRIFRLPFSWKALGVDVRGRSVTLKVNYRTSHHSGTDGLAARKFGHGCGWQCGGAERDHFGFQWPCPDPEEVCR